MILPDNPLSSPPTPAPRQFGARAAADRADTPAVSFGAVYSEARDATARADSRPLDQRAPGYEPPARPSRADAGPAEGDQDTDSEAEPVVSSDEPGRAAALRRAQDAADRRRSDSDSDDGAERTERASKARKSRSDARDAPDATSAAQAAQQAHSPPPADPASQPEGAPSGAGHPESTVPAVAGTVPQSQGKFDYAGELMDPNLAQKAGPGVSSQPKSSETADLAAATAAVKAGAAAGVGTGAAAVAQSQPGAGADASDSGRVSADGSDAAPTVEAGRVSGDGNAPAEAGRGARAAADSLLVGIERLLVVKDGADATGSAEPPAGKGADGLNAHVRGVPGELLGGTREHGPHGAQPSALANLADAHAAGAGAIHDAAPSSSTISIHDASAIAVAALSDAASSGSGSGFGDSHEGAPGDGGRPHVPEALTGAETGVSFPAPDVSTAAAALPAPGASTLDRAQLAQQISKHIESMHIDAGHGEMTLNLNPEHLGALRLTVSTDTTGVSARILVETAQAHHAVESARDQLRSALEDRGLSLASLSVSLGQAGSGGAGAFARQQEAPRQATAPAGRRSSDLASVSALPAARPAPTLRRNSREHLDYRA